jgi:hypothetical protein
LIEKQKAQLNAQVRRQKRSTEKWNKSNSNLKFGCDTLSTP